MGTELTKCQCKCNCVKEEANTAKFDNVETNEKNSSLLNSNNLYNENSIPTNQGISLRSLNGFTSPSNKKDLQSFVSNKGQKGTEQSTPSLPNKIENKLKEKSEVIRNFNIDLDPIKVIRIQSVYRAHHLRVDWIHLKPNFLFETNQLVKKLTEEFTTLKLKRAENNNGKYNKKGYKTLYSKFPSEIIRDDILHYDYGKVYQTRILINYGIMKSFYKGSVNIVNEKHGYGSLLQKDGSKYEGFWRNNIFHGYGRYIDPSGTTYEGIFENGKLNGKGTKKSLNSSFYIGDFVDGNKEGKGKEETPEHIYEGDFLDNKKNGYGKLVYKILKDTYEGEFKDNCITGTGLYKWSNNDVYKGTFVNGKMHGKGLYKWPDGGEYYGDYVDNIKEGYGIFKWVNGKIYEGEFKGGKPCGNGKLRTATKEVDVEFKEGKLITSLNNFKF